MTFLPRTELTRRRTIAADIVREAGDIALAAFRNRDSLHVQTKGQHDWVTNVDLETEARIRARLADVFPGEPVLGEETAPGPGARETSWIVDPIDGTTCFLLGLPQWCVVLAYAVDARPVVSAIYAPVTGEMFTASAGGGAELNGEPVQVSRAQGPDEGLIAVGANKAGDPARSAAFIAELVAGGGMFTRIGACALALAYVASGRLLAAYEPLVSPWDDLGGMLLVQEAGGRTNDFAATLATTPKRPVAAATPALWPVVNPLLSPISG